MSAWDIFTMNSDNSERILVLGAGSGRDMATAASIIDNHHLVDLAGFLTPWAIHTFGGTLEQVINTFDKDSKKYLPLNPRVEMHQYYEPLMAEVCTTLGIEVQNVYGLSLHHGTQSLMEAFGTLIMQRNYSRIVVVDVGGDILLGTNERKEGVTPIVDSTCVMLLESVPEHIPVEIYIIAPGSDGELGAKSISRKLKLLRRHGEILEEVFLEVNGIKQRIASINSLVSKQSGTYSNTSELIDKTDSRGLLRERSFHRFVRLGERQWDCVRKREIDAEFLNKMYRTTLTGVRRCNDTKIQFKSVLDAFVKYCQAGFASTEVDFSFVPYMLGETRNVLLVNRTAGMTRNQYRDAVEISIELLKNDTTHMLLFVEENELVKLESDLQVSQRVDGSTLVMKKE